MSENQFNTFSNFSCIFILFFFFKQKTAYEIGTGDWSADVCSSDLASYQVDLRFGRDHSMNKSCSVLRW